METISKINDGLVRLFNVMLKMEEKSLKETKNNLSITEVHTLAAIGTGKPKTMTQVAGILKINVSTLTVAVNKLVAKGYVDRFKEPEDRRIVKIRLTETGRAAVTEHESFRLGMIKEALSDLTPEEVASLAKSIEDINDFLILKRGRPVKGEDAPVLAPISVGGLSVPVPIFQGGMGVGISRSGLAAAVSKNGGVGVISAFEIGFREPDYKENPLKANKRALKAEIEKALDEVKDKEDRGPIGVNIMVSSVDYEEYVRAAIDAGAEMIISGAGVPTKLPSICKKSKVKLVPIVASARAVRIILKNWAKKNRTPDAIIFEGPHAGGLLGFKEEQLTAATEDFYKTIAEIKGELETIPNCKLIVAGGIQSKEDCEKALACGADGIMLGSRFILSKECDAPLKFKRAILKCNEKSTTIIKTPIGMIARVMTNGFINKISAGKEISGVSPVSECNECLTTCLGKDAPYCIKQALINVAEGNVDNGIVFCGSKVYKSNEIETVADVFNDFK